MKLLLAERKPNEVGSICWNRVMIANSSKDGSMSLPLKWNGSLEGHAIRAAAKMMAADSAMRGVELVFGSHQFRVDAIA